MGIYTDWIQIQRPTPGMYVQISYSSYTLSKHFLFLLFWFVFLAPDYIPISHHDMLLRVFFFSSSSNEGLELIICNKERREGVIQVI